MWPAHTCVISDTKVCTGHADRSLYRVKQICYSLHYMGDIVDKKIEEVWLSDEQCAS